MLGVFRLSPSDLRCNLLALQSVYNTVQFRKRCQMNDQLKFYVLRSQEFNSWFVEQTKPTQILILARLHRISVEGHFGTTNYFDNIIELKWTSGLRIYTARIGQMVIVVLGGGNKNGQNKDIKKAKKTLEKIKKSYLGSP